MISVQNLVKIYVGQTIFDDVSFKINQRERVGLVGRNGHGKTTLFNLITGKEQCDNGSISIPKDYSIGYINQEIQFSCSTILDECCKGFLKGGKNEEDWKAKKILSGLGFSDNDFDRDPYLFSGGYQVRLCLAKVLVSEPNLLLLDEPTNFLDIVSIRWLINFLNSWPNEMIVISHDRDFMDKVTTHIIGIHRCKLRKINGSTNDYYDQIAKEEEVYEKERLNDEKKRKQTQIFISRFRAKARLANLVQSRIKTLEKQKKQKKQKKLEKIKSLSFSFNCIPIQAKYILEARDLTFSYDKNSPYLFNDLSITAENHDRICIIGKNGKGKTTLLKVLAGKLKPLKGDVKTHPRSKIAYFEQGNITNLNDNHSVEQEISLNAGNIDKKSVRDVCGKMMFSEDYALKKIQILSGGEKCRVLIGKLLLTPSNLLLLDEPTHHLDMESCNAMIKAITSFQGTAIVVSHDVYLLNTIANKLIVFHKDKVFLFRGTYPEFMEQIGWDDESDTLVKNNKSNERNKQIKSTNNKGKELRKSRATFFTQRSKALEPYNKSMQKIEKDIEKLENQIHKESNLLIKASQEQNVKDISTLSKSMKQIRTRIDILYKELENINDEFEQKKSAFDLDQDGSLKKEE